MSSLVPRPRNFLEGQWGPVSASGGSTAKLSCNPPSVGGSAHFDVAYFGVRKSSHNVATAKVMPKISGQVSKLHRDFFDTFRPTQRIRCVDSYRRRSSMDPAVHKKRKLKNERIPTHLIVSLFLIPDSLAQRRWTGFCDLKHRRSLQITHRGLSTLDIG